MFVTNGIVFNHESPRRGECNDISISAAQSRSCKREIQRLGRRNSRMASPKSSSGTSFSYKLETQKHSETGVMFLILCKACGLHYSTSMRMTLYSLLEIRIQFEIFFKLDSSSWASTSGMIHTRARNRATSTTDSRWSSWEGDDDKERGVDARSGNVVVKIDPDSYGLPSHNQWGDSSKALKLLGWKPQNSFDVSKISTDRCAINDSK